MTLELRQARPDDFPALQQMLELYQYELSDIWPQDLDAEARYGYDLERHRQGDRFCAHVALEGSQYVGFALVAPAIVTRKEGWWMEQFFILKRYRRGGAGRALALHVLHSRPGPWEIGQMPANLAAQAFWRRVVGAATASAYVELQVTQGWWQGVVQQFDAPAAGSDGRPTAVPPEGAAPGLPSATSATLRQAVRADIPGIQRVRAAVKENRLVSRVISDEEVAHAIEVSGRGWVVEPGVGTGMELESELGTQVVAFAIGDAETGGIWALFVDPAHEGHGHGRRLHDTMVGWLWSRGLTRLWLSTDPNTRADRFYQAAGWQRLDVQPDGEVRFERCAPISASD